MAEKLQIDFVSDVVCPWCVIGLGALTQALEKIGPEIEAEIHFQPFELNPDMAPEGENVAEHIQRKYGSTAAQSQAARAGITERGAEVGFAFNWSPESRIWNTFNAHRLLYWAGQEGKQRALKEALFSANFNQGRDVSDAGVLAEVAQSVGLDGARAAAILASDEYAQEVRAEEALWRQRGIQAVPSVVVNGRWMIQGGQPAAVFEEALRRIASGAAGPA